MLFASREKGLFSGHFRNRVICSFRLNTRFSRFFLHSEIAMRRFLGSYGFFKAELFPPDRRSRLTRACKCTIQRLAVLRLIFLAHGKPSPFFSRYSLTPSSFIRATLLDRVSGGFFPEKFWLSADFEF
jgi:hypothetical protein